VNTISFQTHTGKVSSTHETMTTKHTVPKIWPLFHLHMDAWAKLSLISIVALVSVKHFLRHVIIRAWRTSWHHHQKVNRLYFWLTLGTKITILAISNAQYFPSAKLLTDSMMCPQRCLRHFNPLIASPTTEMPRLLVGEIKKHPHYLHRLCTTTYTGNLKACSSL
jgi:hypothetical protein